MKLVLYHRWGISEVNAKHVHKGPGQRSAWLRILPLSHRTGRGTGMARASFPLLQNARLEGSSLRPTAAPPVLPELRPSTGAEHPGGARTEQDRAPREGSTDPGTALGAGGGGGRASTSLSAGASRSLLGSKALHAFLEVLRDCFSRGLLLSGRSAGNKTQRQQCRWGPHTMAASPLAVPYRGLRCGCWAMPSEIKLPNPSHFLPVFWPFLTPPASTEERCPMGPLSLSLPAGHPVHRWQKHAGESRTAVPDSPNWVTVHGSCARLVSLIFAPLHPAAQGFSCRGASAAFPAACPAVPVEREPCWPPGLW